MHDSRRYVGHLLHVTLAFSIMLRRIGDAQADGTPVRALMSTPATGHGNTQYLLGGFVSVTWMAAIKPKAALRISTSKGQQRVDHAS